MRLFEVLDGLVNPEHIASVSPFDSGPDPSSFRLRMSDGTSLRATKEQLEAIQGDEFYNRRKDQARIKQLAMEKFEAIKAAREAVTARGYTVDALWDESVPLDKINLAAIVRSIHDHWPSEPGVELRKLQVEIARLKGENEGLVSGVEHLKREITQLEEFWRKPSSVHPDLKGD